MSAGSKVQCAHGQQHSEVLKFMTHEILHKLKMVINDVMLRGGRGIYIIVTMCDLGEGG